MTLIITENNCLKLKENVRIKRNTSTEEYIVIIKKQDVSIVKLSLSTIIKFCKGTLKISYQSFY